MIIPGQLIALATFPGVIIHETAHRYFCDKTKTPVYEVKYFRIGNPAGYVLHGEIKGLKNAFLISVGPLILNSILCMIFTFPVVYPLLLLNAEKINTAFYILAWIGFSTGMHAFPSTQDMNILLEEAKKTQKTLQYYITLPFTLLVKLANILSIIWFDLFYAIALSWILPTLLLNL